jgi:hypothetical protein
MSAIFFHCVTAVETRPDAQNLQPDQNQDYPASQLGL